MRFAIINFVKSKIFKDKSIFLLSVVFIFLLIATIGVLIIKFDTAFAAEFADNVLRPVVGNTIVGILEKSYFNTTDKIQRILDKNGSAPEFLGQGIASLATPIPISNSLPRVKGEGIWLNRPLKLFPGREVMAYTFVRPDHDRPYAYVTLVQTDMSVLKLGAVAGTKQPGGPVGNFGPGKIPSEIVAGENLIAAFDGGFQYRDGEFGMIVEDKTYLPLRKDVGTLIGYKNGIIKIVDYTGQDLGKNIEFIRQNAPMLVENGQIFAKNEYNKKLWGRTFNSDIYTWRSGVGITKDGNLIYAVGNNLSPESLATALQMGGAENAIQLDINPFWVRFNIFEPDGQGGYTTSTLLKGLKDGSKQYLNGYEKDFFFLYRKN